MLERKGSKPLEGWTPRKGDGLLQGLRQSILINLKDWTPDTVKGSG